MLRRRECHLFPLQNRPNEVLTQPHFRRCYRLLEFPHYRIGSHDNETKYIIVYMKVKTHAQRSELLAKVEIKKRSDSRKLRWSGEEGAKNDVVAAESRRLALWKERLRGIRGWNKNVLRSREEKLDVCEARPSSEEHRKAFWSGVEGTRATTLWNTGVSKLFGASPSADERSDLEPRRKRWEVTQTRGFIWWPVSGQLARARRHGSRARQSCWTRALELPHV